MAKRAYFEVHETGRLQELAGVELASFGARAAAYAVDLLVASAAFVAIVFPLAPLYAKWRGLQQDIHFELDFHTWYSLVWFVLYFGLALFWGNGRTPGKRLFGIRVVSLTHARLSLWDAIERALGYAASTAELGFGFLQFFTHHNRRTLHDRIADTVVVREARRR